MEKEQQWLEEYDICDLSRALIRQYLIQNKLSQTLRIFESQTQTSHKKIAKSALIKCLFLGSLFHTNKNKQKPLKSLLEILVQYLKNKFEQKFNKEKTKQQSTGIMSEKNSQAQSRNTFRDHQDALDLKLLETKNLQSNMKKKLRPQTANPKKDMLKSSEQKLMTNTVNDFKLAQVKGARKISTDNDAKNDVQLFLAKDSKLQTNKEKQNKQTQQSHVAKQYQYDQQEWQKQEQNHKAISQNTKNIIQTPLQQKNQETQEKCEQIIKKIQPPIQLAQKTNQIQMQQDKRNYQEIKRKQSESGIKKMDWKVDEQNPQPAQNPKKQQQISIKKQIKQPEISSRMGGMRKMGTKKANQKKLQNIEPITCTTHQSKAQTQEMTPIGKYQKETVTKELPKNEQEQKKMVHVFGKKKKQNKKQQPYECKKFKFDENFVDAPLRTANEKYQYQPFCFHQITVLCKIQENISYTNKPQMPHTSHTLSKKKTEKSLTTLEVQDLKKIIFQYNSPVLPKSWHQGFILSPHSSTPYGLKQIQGGPCGIIAAVQCFYLKHLLYYSKPKSEQDIKNQTRRQICLVAAITDMLMKVKNNNKIILAVPPKSFVGGSKLDLNSLMHIIVEADNFKSAFQGIWNNRQAFIGQNNHGVAVLMYSIVTTKGIQNIRKQMDCEDNPLIGNHGHCTQQLVNLFITGKAASNCFDGEKLLQDDYKLRGIAQKSQFGFLTIFETLKYIEVGKNLKNPIYPIWIICKEFHYHVIFANHYLIAQNNDAEKFDMVYYDGLYNCADKIIITLQRYPNNDENQIKIKQLPLIQQVMMTKWGLMKTDWNGSVRIL